MRIVFMGTPDFAVAPLKSLLLNHCEVVAVYTQLDKPAGRGQRLMPSPVKQLAGDWNLPVLQPDSLRKHEEIAKLAELHPDVIVVAAFGQILPQPVLDLPPHGCLNLHPSLLPRFRGASPVAAAILAGDEFTGVSIMLMDMGMDTGPVLSRAQIPVSPQDNTGSLTEKLSLVSARVLQDVLVRWMRNGITPEPQNETDATYCRPIASEDGKIDWHLPAPDIWRRVRAFNPWPGCFTFWQDKKLKILEARPLAHDEASEAGRVITLPGKSDAAFGVHTGNGILGVLRVQMEGKRAISSAEFLRGQRQFIGAVLPS